MQFLKRTRRLTRRKPRAARAKKKGVPTAGRVQLCDHLVASPLVHPAHDGLKIGHLSDLHVVTGIKPRRLLRAIAHVNAQKPDLVMLTGDYVCISTRSLPRLTAALKTLTVKAYATLGNHDHYAGAEKVRAALTAAGVTVLSNDSTTVMHQGEPLHIVGIDDEVTGHADPGKAFKDVPSGGTRIVLAHYPRTVRNVAGNRAALVLSGHTHGGQICVPKMPAFTRRLMKGLGAPYLAGFYLVGEMVLYVNRGLGAAVPLRVAAPMEVALLTLRNTTGRASARDERDDRSEEVQPSAIQAV